MTNMERRQATDIKAQGRKLTGYAAVFGQETRIADFSEVIKPGAFADALKSNPDILALMDHDASKVLARTKSGTLRLEEDAHGLRFEIDVPDTQIGRDVLTMAERGDVGGMSFGFVVPGDGEEWQASTRTLTRIGIYEISVVSAFPAYSGTVVQARSKRPRTNLEMRLALLEMEENHVAV